jgi:hypothetical protein
MICSARGRCVQSLGGGGQGTGGTAADSGMSSGGGGTAATGGILVIQPSDAGQMGCVDVDVQFTKVIPSVMLLVDQSGSMSGTKWTTLYDTLMNPTTGVVKPLESEVRFGLTMYTDSNRVAGCPDLTQVPIALNNYLAIDKVYAPALPDKDTPMAESVEVVTAQLVAYPEPGPKVMIFGTDANALDTCTTTGANAMPLTIANIDAAYKLGIRTFIIYVGTTGAASALAQAANVGQGFPASDPVNRVYLGGNATDLRNAFNTIIGGVRSCTLNLNGNVVSGTENLGLVSLDGQALDYLSMDGWRLNSSSELELLGTACQNIQNGDHALKITFPCEAFIIK